MCFITVLYIVVFLITGCTAKTNNDTDLNISINNAETEPQATASAAQQVLPPYYNEYTIGLKIDPNTRYIWASQKVTYKNQTGKTIDKIYFNVYLNALSKNCDYEPYLPELAQNVFQKGKDYAKIIFNQVTVDNENVSTSLNNTVLTIQLNDPLPPMDDIVINMDYECYIPKINFRTGANDTMLWCSNIFPSLAVYDEGRFHTEPYYPVGNPFFSEIANYNVTIQTPIDFTVITTGDGDIQETNNINEVTAKATLSRGFAFIIGKDFEIDSTISKNGVIINYYYKKENSDSKHINMLLSKAADTVDYMSDTVGSYPYASIAIVENNNFFSEGDTSYHQLIFTNYGNTKNESALQNVERQIIRQWFYNIIGTNQIKEPWLHEGFSLYMEIMFLYPDSYLNIINTIYADLRRRFANEELTQLNLGLENFDSWELYYDVHQKRSMLMIYNLSRIMGDETFKQFLKAYYNEYSFKIANKDKFIEMCEDFYKGNLKIFFRSWIEDSVLPNLI